MRYFERREQMKEIIRQYSNLPVNRRIKYASLCMFGVDIVLLFVLIIWMDDLSWRASAFLEGCVGLCAIIGMILTGIYLYRVYRAYWRDYNQGSPKK